MVFIYLVSAFFYHKFSRLKLTYLENGIILFLWFGQQVSSEWMTSVFGVSSPLQLDVDKVSFLCQDNPLSARVFGVFEAVKSQRPRCMRVS